MAKNANAVKLDPWFILGPAKNIPFCEGCKYYGLVGSGGRQKACHYILIERKKRPCDPGEGCGVRREGPFDGSLIEWNHDGRDL